MGRGRLEESVSFSTGTAGNVHALWATVSAETGYEQLMERNVSNCTISCDCPTAPCAEIQTSSRMFALLFQQFVEPGKREVAFSSPFLQVGPMMPTILHTRRVVCNPTWYLGSQSQRLQGLCRAPSGAG